MSIWEKIIEKNSSYWKKIMQLRLVYSQKPHRILPKNLPLYSLLSYVNNNFMDDFEYQKLVIEYCYFIN